MRYCWPGLMLILLLVMSPIVTGCSRTGNLDSAKEQVEREDREEAEEAQTEPDQEDEGDKEED